LAVSTQGKDIGGSDLRKSKTRANTVKLKESPNLLTIFKMGLKENDLATIKTWNIA
jgi:hypothetical protein